MNIFRNFVLSVTFILLTLNLKARIPVALPFSGTEQPAMCTYSVLAADASEKKALLPAVSLAGMMLYWDAAYKQATEVYMAGQAALYSPFTRVSDDFINPVAIPVAQIEKWKQEAESETLPEVTRPVGALNPPPPPPITGVTTFFTNSTTPIAPNTACMAPKTCTVSGWAFSVSSSSNCGFNWTNTTGGDGRIQFLVGFGSVIELGFGSDDGSEFELQNLLWGVSTSSWTSRAMLFQGYKNGAAIPQATLVATTPAGVGLLNTTMVTFTNNPYFTDVDDIRVTNISGLPCNSILYFEEITTGPSCITPTLNLAGSNTISCNGGNNGSATVTPSGGPPFTYTWSPSGGNAATASGLSAGTYTCAATNSCGLIASTTVVITQPPALLTSTAVTNVACNGGSNGVAAITGVGGAGGYSYLWSNGASTSAITGLMAGVYTATVTDANGCKVNKSAQVTQPSALVTTTAVTNVACNGGSNGVASITASGGAGGYSYLWSNGGSTSAITGLLAGVYTATVTDANSCTGIKSALITQPPALVTTTAVTNVACNGGSNGVASITPSGGAGGYSYLWSNGASTSAITGLLAGVYTATVTDANSCTSIKSAQVTQPTALVTTTAVTNVACNGGSNGVASITASGGAGGYSYLWSNGGSTSAITGLLAGIYTATVTDANGCKASKSALITQPTALVTTTAVTNVACNGGSNGVASITPSGGAGGYSYLWSNGGSTSAITGLMAGVYTATVTDANSCTSIKSAQVTQPTALVTTTAVTNVACNGGSNGVASITASGGAGGYSYLWSNGGSTSAITGLLAGVYTATVTDANSCTSIKSALITQPPALVTTTAVTTIACNGNSTGSATITASGGTGAHTYLWSNGATTSVISGLMAGVYTATVTDANTCTSIKSAQVTQPSALVTTTAVTNVACNGGSNGVASITPSGGAGGYTYLWSNGASTSAITGLLAGVYTATVTDANSCTSIKSAQVTQPSALVTTTAVTNNLCHGGSAGSATVTASGGTPAYTYLWSTGATGSSLSGQLPGVRTVTVTDANSCTATNSVTVTEPATAVLASVAVSSVSCHGGSNGTATVTATGGTGAYTYLWSTGASTSVITGQTAAVKTVTVTDANACTAIANGTVVEPTAITTSTAATSVLCNGGSTGSATVTASGGTGSYTYVWSTGAATSAVAGQTAGVKTVTVTDANACMASNTVNITQPSALNTSTAATHILCHGNATGSATITATGGTPGYTYVWSTGATTPVIAGQAAGVNTATVTDANGCSTTNTVSITEPATAVSSGTAVTNVLCNGNATGSATITATGGTPGYTYIWSTGATTPVISGQAAGVNTATVTDANGCSTTNTVSITEPATAVSSGTAVTNVLCNGNATGSATITATGGTPGYTYVWSTGATTPVISGQAAGVNTATVTDANGCSTTNTVTITEPATAVSSGTAVTNVLCNGNATGSATITATGGTGAYTYIWSTGATTPVIAGQAAGVNTATVTDANGCSTTNTVTITEPATAVSSGTAVTNVLCNGNATGSATITATGGTPGYTYVWSTGATTPVIAGQAAGVNTATVTDANGCSTTNTVSITEPATAVSSGTAVTNVLCNGNATGSATITATGGTPGYTYVWSTGATTPVISGQAAGVNTATVTDANGCSTTNTVTITEPALLTATTAVSHALCNGVAGTATVTATGGTGAYSYLWSTGATTPVISTVAGVYTVTVTDANLCTATNTISLTQPASLTLTAVANSSVICSGNTSTLTASGSGGTGAITYTWVAGPTNAVYVVSPGASMVYTVNITDANNCAQTNTVNLTVNITPTVSVNSGSICSGNSFTMAPSGASTYTYSSGNAVVSPLANTSYSVTGTSAAGCISFNTAISTVTVNATPVISVNSGTICSGDSFTLTPSGADTYTYSGGNAVVSPATTSSYSVTGTSIAGCPGINTAVATINVNALPSLSITASTPSVCTGNSSTLTAGGASSYTWSTGSNASVITVTPAIATTYTLSGTNAAGCTNELTQLIGIYPAATLNVSSSSASVCIGFSSTLTASGVATYTWSTGSNNPVISVSPLVNTTYTVNGTSINGCTASTTIAVGISTAPVLLATPGSTGICNGASTVLSASGAMSYTWSTGSTGASVTVSPAANTVYTVTGESGAGCLASATLSITVYANPTVDLGPDAETGLGSTYQFNPSQNGATSYTWSPSTYLNSATVLNPVATPEDDMTYTLTVTSVDGCTASDVIVLRVLKDLVIANYMSPNGDGQNDTWKVNVPSLIQHYSVTIMDSYGKTVYSKTDHYDNEFDGRLGGQDLPDGVYYYFIKDGNTVKYKGSITLTK